MEKIKTQVRRWGNSLGVILPKKTIDISGIKEGSEIVINIETRKNMTVKDLMKFAKKHPLKFKVGTKESLEEVDRELWSEEY